LTISNNDFKKTICIVCYEKFGEHGKNGWMKCMFRLQGTIAMNDINGTTAEISGAPSTSGGDNPSNGC
jgi:hypothetical protein